MDHIGTNFNLYNRECIEFFNNKNATFVLESLIPVLGVELKRGFVIFEDTHIFSHIIEIFSERAFNVLNPDPS